MTNTENPTSHPHQDTAPGDAPAESHDIGSELRAYAFGLVAAAVMTLISFGLVNTTLVWAPSIPVALCVMAIAQMGVHLVFFLHITTGPDNINNVMALAFGLIIVFLLIVGSLWIMYHLNHNMMPMDQIMQMQR